MILTRCFGDRKVFQITPHDIEQFKKERKEAHVNGKGGHEKERSNVSVNRELEVLRQLLNKAIEWGWLDENPFNRFKTPDGKSSFFFEENNQRVRFLEEDEITKLLEVSPPYLQDIIRATIYTGLRKGDLLNMKWADVNLERGSLVYREQKKRDKLRFKCLNEDMVDLLMKIHVGQDGYIFHGPDGKTLQNVTRSFKTALKKAGVTDLHFHDLRHTSASHLIMRGASLKTVQEHLGHTHITMTQRYSHLTKDFQREQVNLLNGLCGEKESSKKLVRNDQITEIESQPNINTTP